MLSRVLFVYSFEPLLQSNCHLSNADYDLLDVSMVGLYDSVLSKQVPTNWFISFSGLK